MADLSNYPINVITPPFVSAGVLLQSQAVLDPVTKNLTTYPSVTVVNEVGYINLSAQIKT